MWLVATDYLSKRGKVGDRDWMSEVLKLWHKKEAKTKNTQE